MDSPRTRDRIVDTADQLFYMGGYDATSFGDIAEAVDLSRGNFYYHFKSKDDILGAVIQRRIERTQLMLDAWSSASPSPRARLGQFVQMMATNSQTIRRHGCPVGTLCTELAKLDNPSQLKARGLFLLFCDWLTDQFVALGFPALQADRLAKHLLARSQGIAVLAHAFDDSAFIEEEVASLHAWIRNLRPPRPQTN